MESSFRASLVSASVMLKKMALTRLSMGELLSKATITFSKSGASVLSTIADIGILLFYSLKECRFVVFQPDFVERRNTVRGLKLGEERIAFRLVGTGVHHTTCC